jgi:hypothetical protein
MRKLLLGLLLAVGLAAPARADVQCVAVPNFCAWMNVTLSGTTTFPGTALFANGTAAAPSVSFTSDPDTGFSKVGSSPADNITWASGGAVKGALAGGVAIINTGAVGWVSGTDPTNGSAFDVLINRGGAPGTLRISSGTTPTQSGTTCGTGPTITGNNRSGSVALGSAPGLPCTIVFNGTWGQTPRCWLNPDVLTTGTTTVRATSITTTSFVITSTASLVQADKVSWLCESNN